MGSEPIRVWRDPQDGEIRESWPCVDGMDELLALPAADFLALQRRAEELQRERDEVKATHARILAWPPQDVANADARISMAAAMIAKRDGPSGAALLAALDTLKRHRRQQDAEIDRLRTEGGRDA